MPPDCGIPHIERTLTVDSCVERHGLPRLLRRVGTLGFWFFFLKGLLWIASFGFALHFTDR